MARESFRHVLFGLAAGDEFASRYSIAERVGQGGMGAVYRAFDRALDEFVALKILAPISDIVIAGLIRDHLSARESTSLKAFAAA